MSSKPKVPGYTLTGKIGSGSFADVYKAYRNSGKNEAVAVKCIAKGKLSPSVVDSIVTEIALLKKLKHPHIVQMKDFLWDDNCIYIIMEYCAGGDLSSFIRTRECVNESICRIFVQQLASALQYLRQKNVAHMDLKPQNLLLTSSKHPQLKLTDFGLAQSLSNQDKETSLRGSPLYMAPEILLQRSYDASVDLWSVGVILYECLFGKAPYSSKSFADLVEKIKINCPITIPAKPKISPQCHDLLIRLLQRDPEQRITFSEFFSHPFLDMKHMPNEESTTKAETLIIKAKACEAAERFEEAFQQYCEALNYLVPLLKCETDPVKKSEMQLKVNSYIERAEGLKKAVVSKNVSQSKPSTSSQTSVNSMTLFTELRSLVSSTPKLKTALEIGLEAVQYDAEGQYPAAFERYEMALAQIVEYLSHEPKGRRRELLHQQAKLWMDRAETLKEKLSTTNYPLSLDAQLVEETIFFSTEQCILQ